VISQRSNKVLYRITCLNALLELQVLRPEDDFLVVDFREPVLCNRRTTDISGRVLQEVGLRFYWVNVDYPSALALPVEQALQTVSALFREQ